MSDARVRAYYDPRYVTGAFRDPRPGGRTHEGTDLSHSRTAGITPIPALLAGTVARLWAPSSDHGYGHRIDTLTSAGVVSYAHLHRASPLRVGMGIAQGDTVGHEGTSGFVSGSCCHVEHALAGVKRNPMILIATTISAPAGGPGTPLIINPITQEEDMRVVVWKDNVLAFAPGQVRAFEGAELAQASALATLTGRDAKGAMHRVDDVGVAGLCEAFGVPFNEGVMAAVNGDAWQINGAKGGRFWSRDYAARVA